MIIEGKKGQKLYSIEIGFRSEFWPDPEQDQLKN